MVSMLPIPQDPVEAAAPMPDYYDITEWPECLQTKINDILTAVGRNPYPTTKTTPESTTDESSFNDFDASLDEASKAVSDAFDAYNDAVN